MAAGIRNSQSGQPLNNEPHNMNAATNAKRDSFVKVKIKSLRINVFFDGTLNNMYNTELRLKDFMYIKQEDFDRQVYMQNETSYQNDLSNVALLYEACTKIPGSIEKIYIQGAGTEKYERDQVIRGAGVNIGSTGVFARVDEAINLVQGYIDNTQGKQFIYINVFGFSRGSFYARYFCALIKDKDNGLKSTDIPPESIIINFVGLYDTVSSYGIAHYDDLDVFPLDIGKEQDIRQIVHLTAQNDYRYHFPLTNIQTAINDGVGFECSFPGAHSDIGGGYTPDTSEITDDEPLYLSTLDEDCPHKKAGEIPWQWFREQGYYKGEPSVGNRPEGGDFVVKLRQAYLGVTNSLIGEEYYVVTSRRTVPYKDYQFILLNGMKKMAEDYGIEFNGFRKTKLEQSIAVMQSHPVLNKLDQYISQYLMENFEKGGFHKIELGSGGADLSESERKELYGNYIHNSLNPADILANGGNHKKQGNLPVRNILSDGLASYQEETRPIPAIGMTFP